MEEYKKSHYQMKAESISKVLKNRNYEVVVCQDRDEARTRALSMIDKDATVGFGGSLTVEEIGIIEALSQRDQVIYNRNEAVSQEEKELMMRQSLTADYFLTSFNGISKDGHVVNIDNRGNRVAAITYGPKKVFAFVGMNKIYGDLTSTIEVIRQTAAPLNVARIGNLKTPCSFIGTCSNCLSDDCICNTISIMRRAYSKGRTTIFLILEDLGF